MAKKPPMLKIIRGGQDGVDIFASSGHYARKLLPGEVQTKAEKRSYELENTDPILDDELLRTNSERQALVRGIRRNAAEKKQRHPYRNRDTKYDHIAIQLEHADKIKQLQTAARNNNIKPGSTHLFQGAPGEDGPPNFFAESDTGVSVGIPPKPASFPKPGAEREFKLQMNPQKPTASALKLKKGRDQIKAQIPSWLTFGRPSPTASFASAFDENIDKRKKKSGGDITAEGSGDGAGGDKPSDLIVLKSATVVNAEQSQLDSQLPYSASNTKIEVAAVSSNPPSSQGVATHESASSMQTSYATLSGNSLFLIDDSMFGRIVQPCLAQFLGTVVFVFISTMAHQSSEVLVIALAQGFSLIMVLYCFGRFSLKGYFNPCLSICSLLTDDLEAVMCACYVVCQTIGGLIGALFTLFCLHIKGSLDGGRRLSKRNDDVMVEESSHQAEGDSSDQIVAQSVLSSAAAGSNYGQTPLLQVFATEILLSAILTFCVIGTKVEERTKTRFAELTMGLCLTACILCGAIVGCVTINPVMWFGAAAMSNTWTNHSAYWCAPFVGTLLTVAAYRFVLASPLRLIHLRSLVKSQQPQPLVEAPSEGFSDVVVDPATTTFTPKNKSRNNSLVRQYKKHRLFPYLSYLPSDTET